MLWRHHILTPFYCLFERRPGSCKKWFLQILYVGCTFVNQNKGTEMAFRIKWWKVYALTRWLFCVYFSSCKIRREINTKITFDGAHKLFVTRLHPATNIRAWIWYRRQVQFSDIGALCALLNTHICQITEFNHITSLNCRYIFWSSHTEKIHSE